MHQYLADLIRYHRKRSGLTQVELAAMAGVGKNLVYEVEQGKQSIRLDNLLKIMEILNIQLDFHSPLRESFFREHPNANR